MNPITVQTTVNAPVEKVWECWVEPKHITGWAFADESWEARNPENDVQVGGRFKTTMGAKDGSASFDFTGAYTAVELNKYLAYTLDDGRKVTVSFEQTDAGVEIVQTFDPESENPEEFQKAGWQAFLNNFKKYVESN